MVTSEEFAIVSARISPETQDKLERYLHYLNEREPGLNVKMSTAVRMLIVRGLDQLEKEIGPFLLRRGVRVVPCIFIEARNFGEVGCPPGSLTDEVMYGDRPPRLVDFWDDATAREVEQIAIRKVLRVRGDEFLVPR